MKTGEALLLYARALVRIVYPDSCPLCLKDLRLSEVRICESCRGNLRELKPPLCPLCARELPLFGRLRICRECRGEKHYVDQTWSLFSYNDPLRKLLHLIKFRRKYALLRIFECAVKNFAETKVANEFDYVVPVPLDRRKKWERGFNQASVLARFFKKPMRCPVEESLEKKKVTFSQSLLTKQNRLMNLRQSFKVSCPRFVKNKKILLVDDIYTTGATVNECARTLKENGAASVSVFTLARAGSDWN